MQGIANGRQHVKLYTSLTQHRKSQWFEVVVFVICMWSEASQNHLENIALHNAAAKVLSRCVF